MYYFILQISKGKNKIKKRKKQNKIKKEKGTEKKKLSNKVIKVESLKESNLQTQAEFLKQKTYKDISVNFITVNI